MEYKSENRKIKYLIENTRAKKNNYYKINQKLNYTKVKGAITFIFYFFVSKSILNFQQLTKCRNHSAIATLLCGY